LAFHSNYGPVLYHFPDKLVNNQFFHTPPAFNAPVGGTPSEYCHKFWYEKLDETSAATSGGKRLMISKCWCNYV